jgi:O-Antigen ligase
MSLKSRPALLLLCISVFLLFGVPKLHLRIGPMPLYILDVFLFLTFIVASRQSGARVGKGTVNLAIGGILFFVVLSELGGLVSYGEVLPSVYVLGRTLVAFSMFYSLQYILKSPQDYQFVFKAVALGMLLTSFMMVVTSIPPARGIAHFMFSLPFVEPASEGLLWRLEISDAARRGRSFVGVSNLSGAFLCAAWPLTALLYKWPGLSSRWRSITALCLLLAPFGIILSYSRGAILGLVFALGGALVFGSSKSRRGIVLSVLVALLCLNLAGLDSKLFFFDRLESRFEEMVDDPYGDVRETERIYSYVDPFRHLAEKPWFLFVGEGNAVRRIGAARGGERSGWSYHSFFGISYFAYGLLAAFLYTLLIISTFLYVRRYSSRIASVRSINLHIARSAQIAFFAIVPWLLTAHGMVSSPRATAMFLFVVGIIVSLGKMELYVTPQLSLREFLGQQKLTDQKAGAVS